MIRPQNVNVSRYNNAPLSNFCRKMTLKLDDDQRATCSLCGSRISTWHGSARVRATRALIYHAYVHLDKRLFECKHCDQSFTTREAVVTHLNASHSLNASNQNFVDKSGRYEKELEAILTQCFDAPAAETATNIAVEEASKK